MEPQEIIIIEGVLGELMLEEEIIWMRVEEGIMCQQKLDSSINP